MYEMIELIHGLAVVCLLIGAPVLAALVVNQAIADVDLHDAARRVGNRVLWFLADIAHAPALHLPVNSQPTTLTPVTAEQVHDWFVTAEHRALRRLPRDSRRGHHGQHRASAGIPARALITQLQHERHPA